MSDVIAVFNAGAVFGGLCGLWLGLALSLMFGFGGYCNGRADGQKHASKGEG